MLLTSAGSVVAQPASSVVPGPAQDRPLGLRLERRWSVGGSEDDQLVLSDLFASDVAVDARGRLAVIDRALGRVVVYDSTGQLGRTLGGTGKGPGELTAPLGVTVAANGEFHIHDVEKGTIVVFGPDGEVRPEYRLPISLRRWRLLASGARVGTRSRRDTTRLVVAVGSDTTTLLHLATAATKNTPPVCRMTNYPVAPIFSAEIIWTSVGDRVVAATDGFALTVFERGAAVRTLSRATPRRRATRDLARKAIGEGVPFQFIGMPRCLIPATMILDVAEIARELPAYAALAAAPAGRIWATRYAVPGEPVSADIYDPSLGYLGTIALGSARPVAFLSDRLLVSIEPDDEDVPQVVVYSIRTP